MKTFEHFLPVYNAVRYLTEYKSEKISKRRLFAYITYSILFLYGEYKAAEFLDNFRHNLNNRKLEARININKDDERYTIHTKYGTATEKSYEK